MIPVSWSSMVSFGASGWIVAALAILSGVAVWWIKKRPEQTRAESDATIANHNANLEHIKVLQEENKGLRDRIGQLEREYDQHRRECREETDNLHEAVRELKKTVDGLTRQIAQNSSSTAHMLRDGL